MAFTHLTGGHTEGISSLVFNPRDPNILCSTSLDGSGLLWDLNAPATPACKLLGAHRDAINTAVFFADGARLATAGEDAFVALWDSRNTAEPCAVLKGVGAGANRVVLSADESLLYVAADDGCVSVHDIATGAVNDRFMVAGVATNDVAVCSLPEAQVSAGAPPEMVLTAGEDKSLRLWVGGPTQAVAAYRLEHPHHEPDADGEEGGASEPSPVAEQMMRLLDSVDEFETATNHVHLRGPDVFLACSSAIFRVQLDDSGTAVCRETSPKVYAGHDDFVRGIATTRLGDAGAMYTVGDDGVLMQWLPDMTEKPIRRLKVHDEPIMGLALSPCETRIATGAEDTTIKVFPLPLNYRPSSA